MKKVSDYTAPAQFEDRREKRGVSARRASVVVHVADDVLVVSNVRYVEHLSANPPRRPSGIGRDLAIRSGIAE